MEKMKQMPYKVEEGAIEQAKYRAKMAIREIAHPVEPVHHKANWRWASAVAVAAVVIIGVVGFVTYYDELFNTSPMEQFVADMNNASDEVISDLAIDAYYYLDDANTL